MEYRFDEIERSNGGGVSRAKEEDEMMSSYGGRPPVLIGWLG